MLNLGSCGLILDSQVVWLVFPSVLETRSPEQGPASCPPHISPQGPEQSTTCRAHSGPSCHSLPFPHQETVWALWQLDTRQDQHASCSEALVESWPGSVPATPPPPGGSLQTATHLPICLADGGGQPSLPGAGAVPEDGPSADATCKLSLVHLST